MIENREARPPAPSQTPVPQRWQPRFGLGAMMLVMLVVAVGLVAFARYQRWL